MIPFPNIYNKLPSKLNSTLFYLFLSAFVSLVSCKSGELSNESFSGTDLEMLANLNTNYNDGRTVRFVSSKIDVYIGMPDFNTNLKAKIEAWETASGERIDFNYVGSRPSRGIEIYSSFQMPGTCGGTSPDHEDGVIKKSIIILDPISYLSLCSETLKHEVGHALGLLAHTDDKGLMDPAGGNGDISEQTKRIIKTIYNYPSNTPIEDVTIVE